MKESNISDNNSNIYEKEEKTQDKLKEELIFISQNNLKMAVQKYEELADQLLTNRFQKRQQQIQELESKKGGKESKQIREMLGYEQKIIQATEIFLKEGIKFEFDKNFNEDLNKLQDGIDKIFNTEGINRNIKSIYTSIQNNDYSVEKIGENYRKSITKFEEVYREFLLKKLKYKEELEVYNKRQEQILKENIDCKKEYNDINNYLSNFTSDNKENIEKNKQFDDLMNSLDDFTTELKS